MRLLILLSITQAKILIYERWLIYDSMHIRLWRHRDGGYFKPRVCLTYAIRSLYHLFNNLLHHLLKKLCGLFMTGQGTFNWTHANFCRLARTCIFICGKFQHQFSNYLPGYSSSKFLDFSWLVLPCIPTIVFMATCFTAKNVEHFNKTFLFIKLSRYSYM